MTDSSSRDLATTPTSETGKSRPKRVTGRLKAACDIMIFQGVPWEKAAQQAKYSVRSMRLSLEKQHVMKYLLRQRGVRLAQMTGENLRALEKVRDQESNPAAAVQAARALEALGSEVTGGPRSPLVPGSGARAGYLIDLRDEPTAGLVIVVNHPPAQPAARDDAGLTIDVTPNKNLSTSERTRVDENE